MLACDVTDPGTQVMRKLHQHITSCCLCTCLLVLLQSLAYKCWRRDPKTRPSFAEITATLCSQLTDSDWQPVVVLPDASPAPVATAGNSASPASSVYMQGQSSAHATQPSTSTAGAGDASTGMANGVQ